jgi:hypothetical protein
MTGNQDQTVYAAAQGREYLRNQLRGKENTRIREYAGLIDDPDTLDLLNHYCSLYADVGENFLDTRMAEIIIRNAATRTTDRAFRAGNVSQLQGMVGLTNNASDGQDAIMQAADRLSDEGAIYLVLGPPGAGKTAFALDSVRTWKAITGGTVLANVDCDLADKVVTDSESMLDEMASTQGPVIQLIDEAGQTLTSRGSEQQDTDQFAKTLKYIRKKRDGDRYAKKGSVLLIGHTQKDTAAEIRRLASGAFQKPTRKDPGTVRFLDSEGGADRFENEAEFQGVTDTAESYDEHEASHFRVSQPDEEDGQQVNEEDLRRDEAIKTVVRACKPWDEDDGLNYREASKLVDYGKSWVGEKVRECKDGEHRELVHDPTTTDADADSGKEGIA